MDSVTDMDEEYLIANDTPYEYVYYTFFESAR